MSPFLNISRNTNTNENTNTNTNTRDTNRSYKNFRNQVPYPSGHTVSLGWRAPLPLGPSLLSLFETLFVKYKKLEKQEFKKA